MVSEYFFIKVFWKERYRLLCEPLFFLLTCFDLYVFHTVLLFGCIDEGTVIVSYCQEIRANRRVIMMQGG